MAVEPLIAPEQLLRAGALLPLETDVAAQLIGARRYRHPALGDRTVVRLVPDAIGAAEDLALETLDFTLADVRPVALGQPRGLGFPASAILADPPNARHALAVVKEMERYARMVRSKPGNARDGFDEIGRRLARTVPHFLPSFYEQAGRAFLDGGNNRQAAAAFTTARQMERTYGLPIDEARRRQAFLEFALGGALTAKALSEYARDLVAANAPADAHSALKELCVQRTLGGLPPWSGMAAELRRTAKAAGLDPAAEEAEVLRRLVEAPATAKAAAGFWTSYRASLVKLAKADAAFRGRLLNLHPTPGEATDFMDWWVDLLRDGGALEGLLRPKTQPDEAQPIGGPGAWLERTARQARPRSYWWNAPKPQPKLHALVAELAPVIKARGTPVQLFVNGAADLDLLDSALAAGLELAEPASGPFGPAQLELRMYAMRSERRPLTAVGTDPMLAPLLDQAVSATIFERASALAELPGLHAALRRWLREQLAACTGGTLATLATAVFNLKRGAVPSVRALDPETTKAIAATDVTASLARTLRGGLLAELEWPALEAAGVKLDDAHVAGFAWPALIVQDKRKVSVVGPDRVVLEHDVRIPAGTPEWGRSRVLYANNQVFIGWRGREHLGYWSGKPGQQFEPKGAMAATFGGWALAPETSVELADGGRCEGGSPVQAGDTTAAAPRKIVSDGETCWVVTGESGALREIEPDTGRLGRSSRPRFFEEWVEEGWTLDLEASWLMPLPPGVDGTLLGGRGGLVGIRARRREVDGETEWQVESVDGRRFSGRIEGPAPGRFGPRQFQRTPKPVGLLELPGDDVPRVVTQWGDAVALVDPSVSMPLVETTWGTGVGRQLAMSFGVQRSDTHELREGVPFLAPPRFWFVCRARDPEASRALRRLSEADARKLFEAARRDLADEPTGKRLAACERAIAEVLPGVRDDRFREGVLGAVLLAARTAKRLDEFAQSGEKAPAQVQREVPTTRAGARAVAPARAVTHVIDDRAMNRALAGLHVGPSYEWGAQGGRPLEQIAAVGGVLGRAPQPNVLQRILGRQSACGPSTLPSSSVSWFDVIGRLGAVAYRASLPTTSEDDRAALTALLKEMAAQQFPSHSPEVRLLRVQAPKGGAIGRSAANLKWTGDRAIFLTGGSVFTVQGPQLSGFEWARGGRFTLEREHTLIAESRPGHGWGDEAAVERFVRELERRGPIDWDPAAIEVLHQRTGLSRPSAALLLATLPRVDAHEHNFLPPAAREAMGLKVAEARAAAAQLRGLTSEQRLSLFDAAMPSDPVDLWTAGLAGAAERMAVAWTRAHGRLVAIDDALAVAASRQLAFPGSPPDPLRLVADPQDPRVQAVAPVVIENAWSGSAERDTAFGPAVVRSLAITLPWLHASLPVGDGLLARIPDVLTTARARLGSPDLVMPLDTWLQWPGMRDALVALGAEPFRTPRGAKVTGNPVEIGPFVIAPHATADVARTYLRPALLRDGVPAAVAAVLQPTGRAVVEGSRFLLGEGASRIAARAAGSSLAAGSFEADPGLAAPEVVGQVEGSLGLSNEPARLFLQLLALPAPTKIAVERWNSWTGGTFTRAAKALVEAGLAVSAKRQRAGRDVFLGGPWATLAAPDLPVEAWKLGLYGASMLADGSVAKPLDRLVPTRPLHELFAQAWARWAAGDRPAFERLPERR